MFSKKKKSIYLDYAAQTPVGGEVFAVMKPWLDGTNFGNASAIHDRGKFAKRALEESRDAVRLALGAENNSQVVFTSGGTESNTMAICGVLSQYKEGVIITSSIEHPSVRELINSHKDIFSIITIPVTQKGIYDMEALKSAIEEHKPIMVSLMMVNNEIGTVQPIAEVSKLIKKYSPETILHTDASQTPLYETCNVQSLGVDLMTLCGQKIYGPQGSGALYIRPGVEITPLFVVGSQESGMRAGTEPIHQIIGFTHALRLAVQNRVDYKKDMTELQTYFLNSLDGIEHVVHAKGHGLPLATNISFLK